MSDQMKICKTCNLSKSIDNYYKTKVNGKVYFMKKCKKCYSKNVVNKTDKIKKKSYNEKYYKNNEKRLKDINLQNYYKRIEKTQK